MTATAGAVAAAMTEIKTATVEGATESEFSLAGLKERFWGWRRRRKFRREGRCRHWAWGAAGHWPTRYVAVGFEGSGSE